MTLTEAMEFAKKKGAAEVQAANDLKKKEDEKIKKAEEEA